MSDDRLREKAMEISSKIREMECWPHAPADLALSSDQAELVIYSALLSERDRALETAASNCEMYRDGEHFASVIRSLKSKQ